MMKISASQIRQNSGILNEALREDIIVTKREKPYVVIVAYEAYRKMCEELDTLRAKVEPGRIRDAWRKSAVQSAEVLTEDDEALYREIDSEAAERLNAAG